MIPNFRSLYRSSEEQTRFAFIAFTALLAFGFLGTVFFSSSLVVAVVLVIVVIALTFVRPEWTLIAFAAYLPFEPFLLKWIADDVYVFARYGSEMIVYLLVAVVLWRFATGAIQFRRTPIDIAFAVVIFLALASVIVNTVSPWIAILGLRQIFRFVLLFFVAVYLAPSKATIRTLVSVMLVIVGIQSGLGVAQAVIGGPVDAFLLPSAQRTLGDLQLTSGTTQFWDPGARVFGTLGRYDQLGTFMAFFLILLVAGFYEKIIQKTRELPALALLLISVVVLGLTYSRSAWFGFLFAFLFIAILMKRDKRVLAVAVGMPILLAGYLSISGLVVSRIIDSADQSFAERVFEVFSYARFSGEYYGLGRVYWILQTVITVVPHAPLFGFGPGTYGGGAVAALGNTEVYDQLGLPFGVYGTEGYIDNNWFSMWGELGTLGLGAYLVMYLTLFGACIRVCRESKDPEVRALALGVAGTMIAVAINAFLATYLEARTLAPYLWLLSGAVIAFGKEEKIV
jgi:hypothetical protein